MDAISGVQPVAFDSPLSDPGGFSQNHDDVLTSEATLGDKFFQIISDTKQEIGAKTNEIESALRVDEIKPVDLLRLQFEIAEITIQQELISKGISKSTQNVDTLLKAQ
ncbi:type III secretion system inner rod subunit SctI [Microbulbifer sp. TRSA007]|uniref:type III secretion system inner rod subunit SctI n=1 Tax=Microbulbifer sp. TRSA007 TaxID=3243384 RepID=UPI004039B61E